MCQNIHEAHPLKDDLINYCHFKSESGVIIKLQDCGLSDCPHSTAYKPPKK